jgi:hypothetical protein
MTQEEHEQYIQDCIKSEMETFCPEEFERVYGEKSKYVKTRMKIYTYYENINFKNQDELIKLWKESWEVNGFDAIVLSLEDSKKNPYYDEFVNKIKQIHLDITGNDIKRYGLSCYLRWLAYSNQSGVEPFLVSDYDVINRNFSIVQINEPYNELSFMDRYCPCLAYGTSENFLSFCKDIISYTISNKEIIKDAYQAEKFTNYHDQEFLVLNHEQLNYNICPARKYVRLYERGNPEMKDCSLFHFAHRSVKESKDNFPELKEMSSDDLRILLIKEVIKNIMIV